MSNMKKLLDIMNETTVSGSIAAGPAVGLGTQRRVQEEDSDDGTKAPDALKAKGFGLWKNSVLAGAEQRDKKKSKKVAESKSEERNEMDTPAVQSGLKKMAARHNNENWTKEQLADLGRRLAPVKTTRKNEYTEFDGIDKAIIRSKNLNELEYGAGQRQLKLAEENISEEQLLAKELARRLDLFMKGLDRQLGKKSSDRGIQSKTEPSTGAMREDNENVTEDSNSPVGYIDDKGKLVTIGHKPGFAKSVGYVNGGWIDTGRAIPDSWKVVYTKDLEQNVTEGWSQKYKSSINCSHPKGFSQKAHCAGKKKHNESIEMEATCPDCGMCETHGDHSRDSLDEACWKGYHKEGMKKMFGKQYPNCVKNKNESLETYIRKNECPGCGGKMIAESNIMEEKDACYHKVKSRYKVWPSAYASGALVKCRKVGASNWGNSTKKESIDLDENLHDWFNKEKWVRMDTKGNIKGPCARGSESEGKPKCLPQSKAHSLGKKGRASAASRKRREDPNPDRSGKAINVNTVKKKSVKEATGDPKFDKMLKDITGKKVVAKQQKADTKQQSRDAFSSMFGGGNPTDTLSIRKKGVNETTGYKSQFSSAAPAIQYAKDKVKTFRDPDDGIEIWSMPDGGCDVVHTSNSNGRNHCIDNRGKKLGTIRSKKQGNK